MRVLLVEDHQELAETVSDVLRGEGIAADVARDGQAALDRSTVNCYDVIVLDRDLPGVHGEEVCRTLVAGGSQSQVLMLTAAGAGPLGPPGRSPHRVGLGSGQRRDRRGQSSPVSADRLAGATRTLPRPPHRVQRARP
jgi:CheY-like chemotaxis protein